MPEAGATPSTVSMESWQRVARRIRVPLGFLAAVLYLFELWRRPPDPRAIGWSLVLVLPGLWLRAYASGYVKKNQELATTGPYAQTRNPLYLGSMLIAAGFALSVLSWAVALVLLIGFALVYIPVIASEERFLRATFPGFEGYCRRVPRLIPRFTPARPSTDPQPDSRATNVTKTTAGGFSFQLYLRHREYNALLGAALLYLCLLYLRPILKAVLDGAR